MTGGVCRPLMPSYGLSVCASDHRLSLLVKQEVMTMEAIKRGPFDHLPPSQPSTDTLTHSLTVFAPIPFLTSPTSPTHLTQVHHEILRCRRLHPGCL
jgi:hypothetical protein